MARVSIEDCLKNMENRFVLCKVAADRARSLVIGEAEPLIKSRNREAVIALREIADGLILADHSRRQAANASKEPAVAAPTQENVVPLMTSTPETSAQNES